MTTTPEAAVLPARLYLNLYHQVPLVEAYPDPLLAVAGAAVRKSECFEVARPVGVGFLIDLWCIETFSARPNQPTPETEAEYDAKMDAFFDAPDA